MIQASTIRLSAISVIVFLGFSCLTNQIFVPKGRKCRLQEMHCDIMHPDKQCCPGTSCGVKKINNNLMNICMMCLDIGESCNNNASHNIHGIDISKTTCCHGLKCQKITPLSSACVPIGEFKFYPDSYVDFDDNHNDNVDHHQNHQQNHQNHQNLLRSLMNNNNNQQNNHKLNHYQQRIINNNDFYQRLTTNNGNNLHHQQQQ